MDKHKDTNTWMRSFRCNSDLWEAAKDEAAAEGRSLGSVIRELLTDYAGGSAEVYGEK